MEKNLSDQGQGCVCVCFYHQVLIRMCVCISAASKINSCLETFGKCLISAVTPPPLSLSPPPPLCSSQSTHPFVIVSEINVSNIMSKKEPKKKKRRFSASSFKKESIAPSPSLTAPKSQHWCNNTWRLEEPSSLLSYCLRGCLRV